MNNLNAAPGELSLIGLMTEELFYLPSERPGPGLKTGPERDLQAIADRAVQTAPEKNQTSAEKDFQGDPEQSPELLEEETLTSGRQKGPENNTSRKVSGEGKKRILLISPAFIEDRPVYISLADNILKSVNLDMSAAFLLEPGSGKPEEISDLLTEFNPRLIISFGAEKAIRKWPEEALLNMTWKSGPCTFFQARSLEELKNSVGEKKLFWATLSKLFQISK